MSKSIGSKELVEILDNVEFASLNVALNEKYNYLLITQDKWDLVSNALQERLRPNEEWNEEWDY